MSSEFHDFCYKYQRFYELYKAHEEKANRFKRHGDYNAAHGAMNDMVDFWNEMCKANRQCESRTGRSIPEHADNVRNIRFVVVDIVRIPQNNRSVDE